MEKHEERKFKTWCESQGYLCLKLRPVEKARGFPDRTVVTPNGVVFIELKEVDGRVSAHQEYWLKLLSQYTVVYVAYSAEQAINIVRASQLI